MHGSGKNCVWDWVLELRVLWNVTSENEKTFHNGYSATERQEAARRQKPAHFFPDRRHSVSPEN